METLEELKARYRLRLAQTQSAQMPSTQVASTQVAPAQVAPTQTPSTQTVSTQTASTQVASTLTGRLQDEESMPTLTDEIKEFIVKGLARYESPTQVAEAVKENFDVTVCRQQIYRYDPGCSQPPAQRWRDLHAATRQAYLREVAEIGIAQKAVRLAMLDSMARRTLALSQYERAAGFMEQAARECGGIYENRRPIVVHLPAAEPSVPQPSLSPTGAIDATHVRQIPNLNR